MQEGLHTENIDAISSVVIVSTSQFVSIFLCAIISKGFENVMNWREKEDMMDGLRNSNDEIMATLNELIRRLPQDTR